LRGGHIGWQKKKRRDAEDLFARTREEKGGEAEKRRREIGYLLKGLRVKKRGYPSKKETGKKSGRSTFCKGKPLSQTSQAERFSASKGNDKGARKEGDVMSRRKEGGHTASRIDGKKGNSRVIKIKKKRDKQRDIISSKERGAGKDHFWHVKEMIVVDGETCLSREGMN